MTSSPPADTSIPRPGDLLAGKYRVERILGRGGMGVVVAALHEAQGERVAIKVLLGANDPEAAARFVNEAQAAARIQHPNIARCMEVGKLESGLPYMVLELLDGIDLEQSLRQAGPPKVTTAVDHVLEALEAVGQAHAVGIIHRDLKPANLFLARRPDQSVGIKVLDFGVAKAEGKASLAKTSAQALLGSPFYMSPEQFKSARTVDRRADIWSIGVILYELISGACPFQGDEIGALFAAILESTPAPLTQLRADCPPGLDVVVRRCLARDRAERYDSAEELAEALAPFAGLRGQAAAARIRAAHPVADPAPTAISVSPMAFPSRSVSVAPPAPVSRGSSAILAVMAAAILVGVGVGAGAYFAQAPRSTRATASPVTMGGPERSPPVATGEPERSPPSAPSAAVAPPASVALVPEPATASPGTVESAAVPLPTASPASASASAPPAGERPVASAGK